MFLKVCSLALCLVLLSSCSYFRGSTKQDKNAQATPATSKAKSTPDDSLIGMTEEEVKKKLEEPDIVSKTPDNRIIWTYKPAWKLMPDNKGTLYVEFENGKVVKIVRVK